MVAKDKAIVIGSGLAGLHVGCRLARQGVQTLVLEKREQIGGYCSSLDLKGHRFDLGATMLHTPEVLSDCFEGLGRDLHSYLELVDLDPLYEVRFPEGQSVLFRKDLQATADNIARLSPRDGVNFLRYASDMEKLKSLLKQLFIEHRYRTGIEEISWSAAAALRRMSPWSSVEQLMRSYFHSEAIRTALSFQVYYLGASPSACPAVYGMIPYFEVTKGVSYVQGGLGQITEAFLRVFIEEGGRVETGREVQEILTLGRTVCGVRLQDGDILQATHVISNAEAVYTLDRLIPDGVLGRLTRRRVSHCRPSCAPHLTLLGVDASRIDLRRHHTFFMPSDMAAVSRDLFDLHRMPQEFCCYACYPSLTDSTLAPAGRGALYVLTPAPHMPKAKWISNRKAYERYAVEGLTTLGVGGLDPHPQPHTVLDPPYYEHEFNQPYGMGFGVRPSATQIGPLRLGPRVRGIAGLYLTGASTNPGGGIPLVLASGRSTAAAVLGDMGRSPSWRRSSVRHAR